MFKSPFKLGDTIRIKNFTGKVEKIDFQSTTIRTFDQRHVTIYNSDVMTQSIENYARTEIRRIELEVILGYGSNLEKAIKIFENILSTHPYVLKDPAYKILFNDFKENGVKIIIKCWAKMPCNLLGIKSDLIFQITKAFDENEIYIPYSKGIEVDTDYTLTPARNSEISTFKSSPLAISSNPLLNPNLIDFEEIN